MQRSRRFRFLVVFVVIFSVCAIIPLLAFFAWAYSQYTVGIGSSFVVDVITWLVGTAIVALLAAIISTLVKAKST